MQRHKNSAFTLVELIVVITILAILGTIAFISLQGYSAVSRDSVRISDVGTMTTALEVFQINAGKYPLPDQNGIFTYNGETLWTQGLFAGTVINNLSREMAKAPKDPITDKEYTYSISGNKNEFQILNLLEGELTLNGTTQTNAAQTVRTPKVSGTFNGIFVKTKSYLLPIPSIITSLDFNEGDETLISSSTGITSQVISGGTNIPKIGNIKTGTGGITGLSFEPVNISNITTDGDKKTVMDSIKAAYSSSSLKDDGIYEYVLGISGEENLAGLFDIIVLNNFEDVVLGSTVGCDSGTLTGSTYSSISYNYDALGSGLSGTGTGEPSRYTAIVSCDNGVVSLGGESLDELYSFSSHTFTNCSRTGYTGPALSSCVSAYSSTSWASNTAYFSQAHGQGIFYWTVPADGTYTIDSYGAGYSNDGGKGARIKGDVVLTKGDKLKILVGQQSQKPSCSSDCSGHGGTFVTDASNNPIMIAGGGGGSYNTTNTYESCGRITTGGGYGRYINNASVKAGGGTAGGGGSYYSSDSSGGAGLTGNGNGGSGISAKSFTNGGNGGTGWSYFGGFGGGGQTSSWGGGGGGGYSGGGGAYGGSHSNYGGGGGGGSYNSGTNQTNTSCSRSGHGQVIITKI